MNRSTGIVYLVGAGPGSPGLLTRSGAEAIGAADLVIFDHLIHDRLLHLCRPEAERIFAGKSRGKCPVPQEAINQLLVDHARQGKVVVRLKGGDPFVFGRGAEEVEHLATSGIPFRVIPGVTAGVGATSFAGLSITHREENSAVAFVTGHNEPDPTSDRLDWSAIALFPGTLVFYMGFRHHQAICRFLINQGKPSETPAALVCSGSLPTQQTIVGTLQNLPGQVAEAGSTVGPPSLLVVGSIVERRDRLAWFEHLPLFGSTILVTRPQSESNRSASDLEALGAEVLDAPMIRIEPIDNTEPLDRAIRRLETFDWLVFTSSNGVRFFLKRLEELGRDLRVLGHLKLAAIGPSTAASLTEARLRADLVPDSQRSEGMVEALRHEAAGCRILLARADRGRTLLQDELAEVAELEQVPVYRNLDADSIPPEVIERITAGSVDWITLTSSAIARRLHQLLPIEAHASIIAQKTRLACMSPVTGETVRQLGWPVSVEGDPHTWEGLIEAIMKAGPA